MNNAIISGAIAAGIANGGLILSLVGGSAYIAACEFRSTGPEQCSERWLTGLSLMGIGGAGWVGFNTKNPNLRDSTRPSAPSAPSAGPAARRKVEDVAVDLASDQIKQFLSREGR